MSQLVTTNARADMLPTDTKSTSQAEDSKPSVTVSEPLAPPPKPSNPAETPDYFSGLHSTTAGISGEFNPFEQSFGAPSTETPGKTLLPGVAALTSPAIPGASSGGGYNWAQGASLRSGPLSPAMLPGPQSEGYFDSINRGFPTPNESSLRTGLTPGGGGSMFPAPSPNSQALFNTLQSGGATPGTLDFHRTAMNAAARSKGNQFSSTSNLQDSSMDAQHDATDAANGLFMLAKGATNGSFNSASQNAAQMQTRSSGRQAPASGSASANGEADSPDETPTTRGRGKKANAKTDTPSNNRRKSEAVTKGSNKRAKGNSGAALVDPALDPKEEDFDDDDDDDMMMGDDDDMGGPTQGKSKMTDEEKRRNFLERNR